MLRIFAAGALAATLAAPALAQEAGPAAPAETVETQAASPDAFAYPITRKDSGATTYMMRFKSNAASREDARHRSAAQEALAEGGGAQSDAIAFRSRKYAEPASTATAFR